MIDIHCHILYGLDDGAESLEESLAMARQAAEDGVHHVFATPHFTNNHYTHRALVAGKISDLQQEINAQGIDVTIYPGNEVRLESIDFLFDHMNDQSFHYLGEREKFILLEQRWNAYDPDITVAVDTFIENGVTPIIAHPERHPYIREQPELLLQLIDSGAWTQVSVDSMLGKNQAEAEAFSMYLLEHDLIHTIASDAHNTFRKINVSTGYKLIRKRASDEQAEDIRKRLETIID